MLWDPTGAPPHASSRFRAKNRGKETKNRSDLGFGHPKLGNVPHLPTESGGDISRGSGDMRDPKFGRISAPTPWRTILELRNFFGRCAPWPSTTLAGRFGAGGHRSAAAGGRKSDFHRLCVLVSQTTKRSRSLSLLNTQRVRSRRGRSRTPRSLCGGARTQKPPYLCRRGHRTQDQPSVVVASARSARAAVLLPPLSPYRGPAETEALGTARICRQMAEIRWREVSGAGGRTPLFRPRPQPHSNARPSF